MQFRFSSIATASLLFGAMATLGAQAAPSNIITVDATSDAGYGYVDLAKGEVVTVSAESAAPWTLAFKRFEVRLNSGSTVVKPVTAALAVDNSAAPSDALLEFTAENQLARFEAVSAADIPANDKFRPTLPNSIAAEDSPPFIYGIDPADQHRLVPTFNVYVVKQGDAVYKVQFVNYYHPVSGAARNIGVRVARL
jgi:hypothetical protein